MDLPTYSQYVALVNSGEIRKASDDFFSPNFTVFKNNHEYTDLESFLQTKELQHRYMKESLEILGFYKSENGFIVETLYGWVAHKDVDKEEFNRMGHPEAYLALRAGQSLITHSVFFYETEGNKFRRVRVYDLETPVLKG